LEPIEGGGKGTYIRVCVKCEAGQGCGTRQTRVGLFLWSLWKAVNSWTV